MKRECIATAFFFGSLVLYSNPAGAADNLDCLPPFKQGTFILPSPTATGRADRFATQTMCLQVKKSDVVNGLKCRRVTFTSPPQGYLCPTDTSCFGGGTFREGYRLPIDANNDKICVTFHNEIDLIQDLTVSFFVNKKPPPR